MTLTINVPTGGLVPRRARLRDLPRATAVTAVSLARADGPRQHRRYAGVLQAVLTVAVALNAAIGAFSSWCSGDLYVTRRAVVTMRRYGPGRPLRSRSGLVVSAAGVLLFIAVVAVAVWFVVRATHPDILDALQSWTRVLMWFCVVLLGWLLLGLAVHYAHTQAYRTGDRTGVPDRYWLMAGAAAFRRQGEGFQLAQAVLAAVPAGETVVTVARTQALARIYVERAGFRPLRENGLVLRRP